MNLKIKFKGNYKKLHGQTSGKLLRAAVVKINEETSKELIEYDTERVDGSKFDLRYGEYIQLFFVGNLGIPFSTFRKLNKDNFDFYFDNGNEEFEIEVEE